MKYGVFQFSTDYAIRIDDLARETEGRGFESLFVPEHTHIPASRKSPWPGGADLPREYWHTVDPFVGLAAAAAVTTRLKLGTGICLVIERDPIVLAKEVASLDVISNGRVILGIGGGWNAEEMEDHGTDFKCRWKVLRERVLAMKEIWSKDQPEFHGEFVNFDPIWLWPKPVQKGGPPVLLGSEAKNALERVVDYCDGWIPINRRGHTLAERLKQLREMAERTGRRFDSLINGVFGVPAREDAARQFIDIGFPHLVFGLPPAKADKVLPLLDQCAAVAAKLR